MWVFLCLKLVQISLSKFLLYITFFTRNFLNELFELFLSIFWRKYGKISQNYIILAGLIILMGQGYFFFSIRLRHANLSRVHMRNQHRSKLQTLVSSYHSKTSAQRSPSLAICTNSQDLSFFLLSEHFSAKITRVPQKRNMKNMKNLTLSLLYNYSFPYSFFSPPSGISNSAYSAYSAFSLHALIIKTIQFSFHFTILTMPNLTN